MREPPPVTEGSDDPHGLRRFRDAQNEGGIYQHALAELRRGRKTGHWMWFVFPQIAGLGHSATSRMYAIASLREARAYLDDDLLGPRLVECAQALLDRPSGSADEILGAVDAMKLRSSMTLFMRAAPGEPVFGAILACYFDGQPDPETDARLEPEKRSPTRP